MQCFLDLFRFAGIQISLLVVVNYTGILTREKPLLSLSTTTFF